MTVYAANQSRIQIVCECSTHSTGGYNGHGFKVYLFSTRQKGSVFKAVISVLLYIYSSNNIILISFLW